MRNKHVQTICEMTEKLKRNLDQMNEDQKKRYSKKISEMFEEIELLMLGVLLAYYGPVTYQVNESELPDVTKKEARKEILDRQWLEKERGKGMVADAIKNGHAKALLTAWENELLVTRENLAAKYIGY